MYIESSDFILLPLLLGTAKEVVVISRSLSRYTPSHLILANLLLTHFYNYYQSRYASQSTNRHSIHHRGPCRPPSTSCHPTATPYRPPLSGRPIDYVKYRLPDRLSRVEASSTLPSTPHIDKYSYLHSLLTIRMCARPVRRHVRTPYCLIPGPNII